MEGMTLGAASRSPTTSTWKDTPARSRPIWPTSISSRSTFASDGVALNPARLNTLPDVGSFMNGRHSRRRTVSRRTRTRRRRCSSGPGP